MDSPITPMVPNIYMDEFENEGIRIADNSPKLWKKYAVDTHVIQDTQHKEKFLQHINPMKVILFTVDAKTEGGIPLHDTIQAPTLDGTLTTGMYRKLTHADYYL